MKEKVIFDTNFLYNKRATSFFGNKGELERFATDVEIIVPGIVLEELEAKYTRSFEQEKEKFFKTILPNMIDHNTNDVVIQSKLKDLIDSETIAFQKIELTDYSILPDMKKLAIGKLAPFESSDGTDKGFKDAYIYFTILEFLQKNSDKYVFVCVKDQRFKKALNLHQNIIIIESYKEFKEHSVSQFYDKYYIDNISMKLGLAITKENVIEYWHNVDDNQAVLVKTEEVEYVIEFDSNEIVGYAKADEYRDFIRQLVISDNIDNTRKAIEDLTAFINYLSNEEIGQILTASVTNEKLKWFISEEVVKEFIGTLYNAKQELVENDIAKFLKETFD